MNDDLDLGSIRAFVAVVDAGEFTAAAGALRLTRSAVGKALVRLEARLGVRLLNRTTRRVSPTSDGAAFYEACVRLLADLADAENAIRDRREIPRGILKLSLPEAYGRQRILPILHDYVRRWPMVNLEVSFTDRLADVIGDGLDLAVRVGHVHGGAGLVTRVIDRVEGVLCAAPDYVAGRGQPTSFAALGEHDLILFGERNRIRVWPWADARGGARLLRERARVILDSAEAVRLFAIAGHGVAHLPNFLVAEDLAVGRLLPLSIGPSETLNVSVLYPDRRLLPVRVRLFLDLVVDGLRT